MQNERMFPMIMPEAPIIHADKDVKKQMTKLLDLFKDYRLAIYTNAFAYSLEVMLLGNFEGQSFFLWDD